MHNTKCTYPMFNQTTRFVEREIEQNHNTPDGIVANNNIHGAELTIVGDIHEGRENSNP